MKKPRSFEQWRFEVSKAIRDLGSEAYLDYATEPMFRCNYDPKTAAKEWLRKRLSQSRNSLKPAD